MSAADPADGIGDSLVRGSRLLAVRVCQYVLLFVVGLVVARALGPSGRAQYALPLALATSVWVVVNLSLDGSTGALLARREGSLRDIARFLSAATLILGVLGAAVTLVIGEAIATSLLAGASAAAIGLAALAVPLMLTVQNATGLMTRLGALRAYGWATVAGATAQLAFVASLAAGHVLTPTLALAGVALGWAGIAIPLTIALARRVPSGLAPGIDRRIARPALSGGLRLHGGTIALFLNLRADLFIVSALTTAHQTGLYSLSTTLAETVFLASWSLSASAMQPQTEAPLPEASRYTVGFIRQSWMITLVGAVAASAVAVPFIALVYGREWSGSTLPLVILTLAAVALAMEAPARILLLRLGHPGLVTAASLTGFGVNIALNFALVPVLGISGAALASLCSYWVYTILLLRAFAARAHVSLRPAFRRPVANDPVVGLIRGALTPISTLRRVGADRE